MASKIPSKNFGMVVFNENGRVRIIGDGWDFPENYEFEEENNYTKAVRKSIEGNLFDVDDMKAFLDAVIEIEIITPRPN